MQENNLTEELVRNHIIELLTGGFAPVVILLREFHFEKTGIILDGLHFSAWILLGHMRARQTTLLNFMRDPIRNTEVWLDAHWPAENAPPSEQAWNESINEFEQDLQEMIQLVKDPATPLFWVQANGNTFAWAALTNLHHNAYHIGQMKAIGRQLGVW